MVALACWPDLVANDPNATYAAQKIPIPLYRSMN
jgi:hypothetical protein